MHEELEGITKELEKAIKELEKKKFKPDVKADKVRIYFHRSHPCYCCASRCPARNIFAAHAHPADVNSLDTFLSPSPSIVLIDQCPVSVCCLTFQLLVRRYPTFRIEYNAARTSTQTSEVLLRSTNSHFAMDPAAGGTHKEFLHDLTCARFSYVTRYKSSSVPGGTQNQQVKFASLNDFWMTHSLTHSPTRTHTHARAHTHTHTHTHTSASSYKI